MKAFIIFLIFFIASIFIGLKIAEDPGFAFFSYKQWSAEMPLWFAILAVILSFFLGYMLLRLINNLDFSLYRFKNWRQWRRKYKAYSKTNRGLVEMIEGDWINAERDLLEGIAQSDAPLVNYLGAAKAAHERGAFEKRDAYLRKAEEIAPHSEVAIGITQATLLLKQGQIVQAQAKLDHLRLIAPKQKVVMKLLERVYVHQSEWQSLLKLLPSLRKAKLITPEEMQNFEKKIYLELLKANENKTQSDLQTLWNSIPKNLRQQPDLISGYTRQILRYPDSAIAQEEMLSKAIKAQWDLNLVKWYGLVNADPVKQLSKAQKWQKEHPDQPVLLLTLGRLSMRCQLWGQAKTYLENSLKLEPSAETYAEYGKLLEQLGDQEAAGKSYRSGILLTS